MNAMSWAALGVLSTFSVVGCGKTDAVERRTEIRRELLRAESLSQKRLEERAAQRSTDANGDLVPSKLQVGGITLPRGYTPKFVYEREWTYDGELPFNKLEQYFMQRLTATVEHPAGMITRFTLARPVGEPNALPVEVEVLPVPGREDWSRVHIIQPRPPEERAPMTADQIAADIATRRRNAF